MPSLPISYNSAFSESSENDLQKYCDACFQCIAITLPSYWLHKIFEEVRLVTKKRLKELENFQDITHSNAMCYEFISQYLQLPNFVC